MALPEDFLYKLKAANRIDDVMASYVNLQRSGRYLKCVCPFHSEKTPSCVVYPDTESFFCFGCGAGGDVITFTMNIANLSYFEAVKQLAERAGIALPDDVKKGDDFTQRKMRLYRINKTAARFFFDNLQSENGKPARSYLLKRGMKPETIRKYGMGFALNSWSALKDYMLAEGYTENELIDASLLSRSNTGRTFDFFKNRVMFPFIDLRGNIIGFGGRTLDPEDNRKYLNSRETVVYEKNRFLFSMNFAKTMAVKEKRLLLCEGNVDVISLNQAGFENAIATCGTAITEEHARIMSQYCDEVVICYDSDEAGQKACVKAVNMLSQVGVKTKIIQMTGAKDPDEYIQKFGADKFKYILDNSDGAIVFELNKCKKGLDIETPQGKIDCLKRSAEVIADIPNPLERDVYISKISAEFRVAKNLFEEQVNGIIHKKSKTYSKKDWQKTVSSVSRRVDRQSGEITDNTREFKAEEGIIAFLFQNPDKNEWISSSLDSDKFITQLHRRIYISLLKKLRNAEDCSISSFNSEFSTEEMGKISKIINLTKYVPIDENTVRDYIDLLVRHMNDNDSENPDDIDLNKLQQTKRSRIK